MYEGIYCPPPLPRRCVRQCSTVVIDKLFAQLKTGVVSAYDHTAGSGAFLSRFPRLQLLIGSYRMRATGLLVLVEEESAIATDLSK